MKPNEPQEKAMELKPKAVPIEEVLDAAGCSWYTYYIVLTGGLNMFACVVNILLLSFVIPSTDCDLKLTVQQKGILASMVFSGMLVTTHFFGFLSDEKGRRLVAMNCNFVSSILNLMAGFAPGFLSLSIIVFLNGVATAGVIIPTYVYISECVPARVRSICISLVGALGNLPTSCLPVLAMIIIPLDINWDMFEYVTITSWRVMLISAAIPAFVSAMMFLTLHESPKYLLSKGREEEALAALRCIHSANNCGSKESFKVQSVCMTEDESEATDDLEHGALKRMWMQTASLFHKPLVKFTIISCILQAGVVGASNAIILWLPQTTTQMMGYMNENPDLPATMCQMINYETGISFNTSDEANNNTVVYDMLEGPCNVYVPIDVYYVSLAAGLLQFTFYCISGELAQWLGGKKTLVVLILLPAALGLVMNHVRNAWASVAMEAVMAVTLSAGIPVNVGLAVEYYPTDVRSTANCISMLWGRLFASAGAQILGALREHHCDLSYYGISAFLIGLSVFVVMLPSKKKEVDHQA